MIGSAAGRAGGRPAADGPARPRARRAAALLAALALCTGVACTGVVAEVTPARAAPGTPAPGPPATGQQPVQIRVTTLEPRTLTPGAVITVGGTLTNSGTETVTDLGIRLQRGRVFTSRAELVAADDDPDADTAVVPTFQSGPAKLEPGDSVDFTYTLPAAALELNRDGVYPVLLNVNGAVDGVQQRVGELATYLVQPPATPQARTTVAWLWPLVDPTHRDADGRFVDDRLAREVSPGGRLDRALAVVERIPRAVPPGGSQPVPVVPVTLAIDPALVEALEIMAAGPYSVKGQAGAGTGTRAAAAFLGRLRAVAAVQSVVALPYGDVDAESLQTAGLADVVTRSLPGTPSGTAQDPRFVNGEATTTPTPTAGGSPTSGSAPDGGRSAGAGAAILARVLGVAPRTDLAWAPDGTLHPETLATLRAGGADEIVLGRSALTGGDAALGLTGHPAVARTTVSLAAGAVTGLVGDGLLGGLADSAHATGGPRIAEQRYLAELALVGLQSPTAATTVLVTPPREVDPNPAGVDAMLVDATTQPWLQAGAVENVAAGPGAPAGQLAPPAVRPRLDPTGLADVAAAVAVRTALGVAANGNAAAVLAPYDAAIARATSLAFRSRPAAFRAAAKDLRDTVGTLRDRVTLVAPADGTYSLASSDSPLVLTVRNDLPFPVTVLLRLQTRSSGITFGDIGRQVLAPGQRTTLQVPTQLRRSGGFGVTASLVTLNGDPLGDPVEITVKSTAYGSISLIITIVAAALLGLLFLRRLVRFLLRRRGRVSHEAGPPAPEQAPRPPTRSPV